MSCYSANTVVNFQQNSVQADSNTCTISLLHAPQRRKDQEPRTLYGFYLDVKQSIAPCLCLGPRGRGAYRGYFGMKGVLHKSKRLGMPYIVDSV